MDSGEPLSFEQVWREERARLRPAANAARPFRALCISGGGIRSATFALGALQEMARRRLLNQFDYLSTVSGGGYIGGWLTAWMHRRGGLAPILPELEPNATPPPSQPDPVEHLRAYNNYMTPRLGALSADTWTLAMVVARNIFLNWLVFVPLLLAGLMLPRLLFGLDLAGQLAPAAWVSVLPWAAAVLFSLALFKILRFLPGVGGVNHTTGAFEGWVLAPITLAAALFAGYESFHAIRFWPALMLAPLPCLAAWLVYVATARGGARRGWRELCALFGAVLVLGLGMGVAAWLLQSWLLPAWLLPAHSAGASWPQFVTCGVPLLLIAFSLAGALFTGLSSHVLGTQDREWMARAAAYLALVTAGWALACAAVLLAPGWIEGHPWKQWSLAALGAACAWAASQLGFHSPGTPETADAQAAPARSGAASRLALKVAPAAFLALLAVALGILTDWLLASTHSVATPWNDHSGVLTGTSLGIALIWTAGFAALAWFMGRYININKFSLQGMYRDRLIRAYLGASNPKEAASPFTGFSTTDDIALHDLDAGQPPLQVVNMTLNLVTGERLAWQQRKAEVFTATALHCGSPALGYRAASAYGGQGGITLGTAVAVSGAAASPNMGYHSSPLVGFLMTLFNVRLGAWLGNPGTAGRNSWTHAGPRQATRALWREALGKTTDTSAYVYLSDGGHFENLGMYEMVRRRCQTIVVLDGGCDPAYTFEDLGNALRKIRIDLKVPIIFPAGHDMEHTVRAQRCAVARIHYSAVDPGCADGELLYLKPVLLATEPPDVASYAAAHPDFPHQSTSDQWFEESQTESYRMLGIVTVADLCRNWNGASLEDLVDHCAGAVQASAAPA